MTTLAVAILYQADSRALHLSLSALARQSTPPSKVFVMVKTIGKRPLVAPALEGWPELQIEVIEVQPREHLRNVTLGVVAGYDVATVIREGMVLSRDFVVRACSGGQAADAPIAVLMRASRSIDINELSLPELMSSDPFALGSRRPGRLLARLLSVIQSRYFTPSLLQLRPAACQGLGFEDFAVRSDWSAYRLFLDDAMRQGSAFEAVATGLLHVGRQPDRRGGYEQGKTCSTELYRLAEAYPNYRTRAWLDRRLLALEQLVLLSSPKHSRSARAFLRGMFSQREEEAALRHRLRRDIARLQ